MFHDFGGVIWGAAGWVGERLCYWRWVYTASSSF
jgi:hypothetical protein